MSINIRSNKTIPLILKPEDSILCSVIVPVYNVAGEIKRCLDSLLGQTLREIEILCIDDKSTDNSLEILRDYEKKDSRIKIIALEKNCGVSVARNQGLAIASGEYIGFVDPDDFVDPTSTKNSILVPLKQNLTL